MTQRQTYIDKLRADIVRVNARRLDYPQMSEDVAERIVDDFYARWAAYVRAEIPVLALRVLGNTGIDPHGIVAEIASYGDVTRRSITTVASHTSYAKVVTSVNRSKVATSRPICAVVTIPRTHIDAATAIGYTLSRYQQDAGVAYMIPTKEPKS